MEYAIASNKYLMKKRPKQKQQNYQHSNGNGKNCSTSSGQEIVIANVFSIVSPDKRVKRSINNINRLETIFSPH